MIRIRGTTVFDGRLLVDAAVFRRRHLGFVFQKANLIPFLTALENVQLAMTKSLIYRSQRDFSNIVQVFFWRVYFSWRARRASVTLNERIFAIFSQDFRESFTFPDSQRLTVAGLLSSRSASSIWDMPSFFRSVFNIAPCVRM